MHTNKFQSVFRSLIVLSAGSSVGLTSGNRSRDQRQGGDFYECLREHSAILFIVTALLIT